MLEFGKDNPDNKAKAEFMAQWIKKYYRERGKEVKEGFVASFLG